MQSMQRIWKRIEAGFETIHASDALRHFQPGATDEAIQAVETALGITFPEDVKASYCIHNGSNRQALIGDPDQRSWGLCSLDEVMYYWKLLEKYDAGWKMDLAKDNWYSGGVPLEVRVEAWNLQWIPLLNSDDGTVICLDLAPTPHGEMGQIIKNDPENGTEWLAESWQDFLSTFADDLEAGQYAYKEGRLAWS